MPSPRRLRTRLAQVLTLVLTVVAFLGAETGAMVHDAFVVHYACPEHEGQIEDVPIATQGHVRASRTTVSPASPRRTHRSCELPPALADGGVVLQRSAPLPLPSAVAASDATAPEGVPGRTGPPILQLAPKLCPPVA